MLTRKISLTMAALGMLVCVLMGGSPLAKEAEALFVEHELVLKMIDSNEVDLVNAQYGTTVAQHLPQLEVYLLLTSAAPDLDSLAAEIQAMPEVEFCHPNYLIEPLQPVQGSLPISDEYYAGTFWDQDAALTLNLATVHQLSTGAGVRVGVIDGGANFDHPVLTGSVSSGYDYVDDDNDANDELGGANSGHGTFVSGVIRLVAPDAEVWAYRVADTTGAGDGYMIAEAMLQAVLDGCDVLNLSLVTVAPHGAIVEAAQFARTWGVMVVVAAGNGYSEDTHYPGSDVNTVAVAAVDTNNVLADFSSYGEYIDICAPGTAIYGPYQDTGYAWWGGTSFAAPFVTAQVALIRSLLPGLPWDNVYELITTTAENIDDINAGYAGLMGAGLIDPDSTMDFLASEDRSCGDLTGDYGIGIDDMVAVTDYLYGSNVSLLHLANADVDKWNGVTGNDLQSFLGYMFNGGSSPDCNPVFEMPFPASVDTVEFRGIRVPPFQDRWNADVWLKAGEVYDGVAVPFRISDSQPDVLIDSIVVNADLTSDLIGAQVSDDGREGVLATHNIFSFNLVDDDVYFLGTVFFSGTYSNSDQLILLDTATTSPSNVLVISRDGGVSPSTPHVLGTVSNPRLTDVCGDVDGSVLNGGDVDLDDVFALIDLIYSETLPQSDLCIGDVDGVPGLGCNDIAVLYDHLTTGTSAISCCDNSGPGYALSHDTVTFISAVVPAGVDNWTAELWSCAESDFFSLAATVTYDLPGSTIELDSIVWHVEGDLPNAELVDRESQRVALLANGISGTSGYHRLATLWFSLTPLAEPAAIEFATVPLPGPELTSLYSRKVDGIMTGTVPVLHVRQSLPELDSFGHRCYGDMRGNVDCDVAEAIGIEDLVLLVQFMFQGGAALDCVGEADVAPLDGPDGMIRIDDLVTLVMYMFGDVQQLPTCR